MRKQWIPGVSFLETLGYEATAIEASWEKMAAIPDDCERTATVALPIAASAGFISG